MCHEYIIFYKNYIYFEINITDTSAIVNNMEIKIFLDDWTFGMMEDFLTFPKIYFPDQLLLGSPWNHPQYTLHHT